MRLGRERGQTSVEYVGVILVAAAVVAVILAATPSIASALRAEVVQAICQIAGDSDCSREGGRKELAGAGDRQERSGDAEERPARGARTLAEAESEQAGPATPRPGQLELAQSRGLRNVSFAGTAPRGEENQSAAGEFFAGAGKALSETRDDALDLARRGGDRALAAVKASPRAAAGLACGGDPGEYDRAGFTAIQQPNPLAEAVHGLCLDAKANFGASDAYRNGASFSPVTADQTLSRGLREGDPLAAAGGGLDLALAATGGGRVLKETLERAGKRVLRFATGGGAATRGPKGEAAKKLQRALADDFRGGSNPIGDGSALDAAAHTVRTGDLVRGADHLQKVVDMRNRYARILRRGGLNEADTARTQARYRAYDDFATEHRLDDMMQARGLR